MLKVIKNNKVLQKRLREWKKQKTRLIVFCGQRKSGKDVFIQYLKKHYGGLHHYRIAFAISIIAQILDLPSDRKILHALFGVNKILFPILGESAYKRVVARLLDKERPRLAIVEAIRTKEEYQEFVVKRKGMLIGISAPARLRYERALRDITKNKEKRDEGRMTFKEFLGDQKKETGEYSPIEREVSWIIKRADFIIENDTQHKRECYPDMENIAAFLKLKKK